MTANYVCAADALAGWREDVLTGKAPTLYPVGTGDLAGVEIGPGLVTLIGGAPGAGKTAFTFQAVVDALRLTPTLRACVCNVEMAPKVLLDRQLARLSGIVLSTIRHRRLGPEHTDRIEKALTTLEPLAERLCFVQAPFDLENVALVADEFGADLILLDYIQRVRPPGKQADRRGSIDAMMNHLREFADAGAAVIVVSAVSRTKDLRGRSSYTSGGPVAGQFQGVVGAGIRGRRRLPPGARSGWGNRGPSAPEVPTRGAEGPHPRVRPQTPTVQSPGPVRKGAGESR